MAEKYVNYVNLSDGTDLLDLRHDSIKPEFLLLGETAHDATGKPIVGELKANEGIAESGQCGENVYWKLYDNGVLSVSGTGAMYDYDDEDFPFAGYSITDIIIGDGVTTVGDNIFNSCNSVKSIIIPDGVTKIGEAAFSFCIRLKRVIIPDSVESIESVAFAMCTALENVTIGTNLTSIGLSAFASCSKLNSVFYKGNKAEWDTISIGGGNTSLLNATLHCEYEEITDADTIDGWNVQVISDGSDPENITKPTLTFVYTVG